MAKTVTLKRTVTIKVIVTEDFKNYLSFELKSTINDLQQKIKDIEAQGKNLIDSLPNNEGSFTQIASVVEQQLKLEKQKQKDTITDLMRRIEEAKELEINSEFIQGTIDGFVGIEVGDNLYQKLGALEIIIKDGIVQDIKGDTE